MNPLCVIIALVLVNAPAMADYYNKSAGQNAPMRDVVVESYDAESGRIIETKVSRPAAKDGYGNAQGGEFDLAVDGAFEGQTVAVLHFYTGESFDFSLPKAALATKGFSVYRWIDKPPSATELELALKKASQLWVISSSQRLLSDEHVAVIKDYFDAGHGVYIWGDNEPYYADANVLAQALFGARMQGSLHGDQTVSVMTQTGTEATEGMRAGHLLTTGLEYLYEGVTIATIESPGHLTPLVYGSAGNLVTAVYERDGKRAILDTGFTRLFVKWDTAGTGRYVRNAAAWLANVERFD